MPIAGAIAWTAIGIAGALLPLRGAVLAVFIGTGAIFYLGILVGKLTGEELLGRGRPANLFDRIFFHAVAASLCSYGIAIPFLQADPTSLPLSVGILTGTMWLPFAALAGHWIGIAHAAARTAGTLHGDPRGDRRGLPGHDRGARAARAGAGRRDAGALSAAVRDVTRSRARTLHRAARRRGARPGADQIPCVAGS
ncbi:MAG: hypothetical protein MUF21_13110 [Gemmatimonadaceae bacterium]|nr:hypothetical protein [Gemmatimonadaceae bacterium]